MEKQANLTLAKKLNTLATVVSAVVVLLVVFMRKIHFETGIDFSFLPPFHATLNGMAAVSLMFSYYFIKNKKVSAHQKANYLALGLSVLFLLSYVVYHTTTEATRYGGEGTLKYVYFFFLITHVILAAAILPFILFTFIRAYTGQIDKHRRMARWVYPLWLYVAITGPICYLMLRPYY